MKANSVKDSAIEARLRVRVGEDIALGPGKAELLDWVRQTGSIREAAGHMDMSYMRAWTLIQTMNRCFKKPLVVAVRGGSRGGGAELTETGLKALAVYEKMEQAALRATAAEWRQLQKLLRD